MEESSNNVSKNATDPTNRALDEITASFALMVYVAILLLSALGAVFPWWRKLLSTPATSVLFFMGSLLTTVSLCINSVSSHPVEYFRITSTALAVIYPIVGGVVFFQKPNSWMPVWRPDLTNQPCVQHENLTRTLAHKQPSMGLLIGSITLCLFVFEVLLWVEYFRALQRGLRGVTLAGLVREGMYLIQKIVQVVVYLALRNRIASGRYIDCASFYFKVLSFYNFVSWLNDVITLEKLMELPSETGSAVADFFGSAMKMIYKALLIDYRLLCSLLFFEHAIEIQERAAHGFETNDTTLLLPVPHSSLVSTELQHHSPVEEMTSSDRRKRNAGYLAGLGCLLIRAVYLTNYVHNNGSWMHVFDILGFLFALICGLLLLTKNDLEIQREIDRDSGGIKLMVRFQLSSLKCGARCFHEMVRMDFAIDLRLKDCNQSKQFGRQRRICRRIVDSLVAITDPGLIFRQHLIVVRGHDCGHRIFCSYLVPHGSGSN